MSGEITATIISDLLKEVSNDELITLLEDRGLLL